MSIFAKFLTPSGTIGIPRHKTIDGIAQRGKGTMEQGDALKTFLNLSRVNYLVFIGDMM